ncbi:ABC transporter permease [Corynebacterium sp. MSK073]|uniref:ABC transporter permease n=1 Tax=Corynebacterium sp. MSK073 TaxID=3050198 RepID=UPI00254E0E02|nr:ABC transporter permease [Corynebacterium sp. MSK073]MDK8815148.1 ABC transporter permease [Corynebacterium sp. MSK073]
MQYSAMKTIGTVAKREMAVALKTKSVVIMMLLLIIGAIATPIIIDLLSGGDDEPDSVAVVGLEADAFADSGLETQAADDRDSAVQLIDDGDVDAALVPADDEGWELLANGTVSTTISTTVNQVVAAQAQAEALDTLNIDAQDLADATPSTKVTAVDLETDEASEEQMGNVAIVLIAAIVVVFSIMTFAGLIGGRVTEEKSSRVVEIILSTVRPVDFLAGKVIGNTIIGLLGTFLILAGGVASLAFTGAASEIQLDYGLIAALLVGEILGLFILRQPLCRSRLHGAAHRGSAIDADAHPAHRLCHHVCPHVWLDQLGCHLDAGHGLGAAGLHVGRSPPSCWRQYELAGLGGKLCGPRCSYRADPHRCRAHLPPCHLE